jgi:hypothetical protein
MIDSVCVSAAEFSHEEHVAVWRVWGRHILIGLPNITIRSRSKSRIKQLRWIACLQSVISTAPDLADMFYKHNGHARYDKAVLMSTERNAMYWDASRLDGMASGRLADDLHAERDGVVKTKIGVWCNPG